ncbi:MAG TPA: hypothetical protein VEW66_07800 [Thermomicrobiales bacterium]|nr:hypothetical protein [Thermomicrobiales bacterium]
MQAERIKERTATQQISGPAIGVTEEFADPAGLNDGPVVWDLDPGTLDVGFSRLRPPIDQPNVLPESTIEFVGDQDDILIEASPRTALYQPSPSVLPPATVTNAPEVMPEESGKSASLEDEVNHDSAYGPDDPRDFDHISFESPRSSLWRSFNQRLRRRFKAQTDPDPDYKEAFVDNQAPYLEDDFLEIPEGSMATIFRSNDPGTWYDPEQSLRVLPVSNARLDATYDGFVDDSLDIVGPGARTGTSEESWRLDEREFPEPQPAEWHLTRRELLSSLPPIESLDDSVQFIAPTPQATPVAPVAPRRPLPDPRSFFDISEPSGLAAFRIALFGSSSRPTAELIGDLAAEPIHSDWATRKTQDRYSSTQLVGEHSSHTWDDGTWSRANAEDMPGFDSVTSYSSVVRVPDEHRRSGTGRSADDHRETSQQRVQAKASIVVPAGAGKCCATCRSFLPDGDGSRGRCTNEWASQHRSVVEADELACRSSFGDWWIAADSTWIPPVADPSIPDSASRTRATSVRTKNLD